MFTIDGGPTQFQNSRPQRLIRRQTELPLGVVAQVPRRCLARLHAIGSHHAPAGFVFHQQVLAHCIETIHIEPGMVRAFQSLAQLDVEDLEAQPARGFAILSALGQPQTVSPHIGMNARGRLRPWRRNGAGGKSNV